MVPNGLVVVVVVVVVVVAGRRRRRWWSLALIKLAQGSTFSLALPIVRS